MTPTLLQPGHGPRAILTLASLCAALSCVSPPEGELEQIEERQGAAVWDPTDRPIPKVFLHPVGNNKCCVGSAGTCATDCSWPTGLIKQEGYDKAAADYYVATGEGTLDTFEGWKAWYAFPARRAGEALVDYRIRTNTVVYYNLTELGLGRELGCSKNSNGDMGCFVTNYGATFNDQTKSLAAAIAGTTVRNTVVISWRSSRPALNKVQFAAYGPDGKRIFKAQLDNKGARPIPQICMNCHGGSWNPDAPGAGSKFGLAQDARFLPMMNNTVVFSTVDKYRLVDQEAAILKLNDFAYQKRSDTLTGRQQDHLHRVYAVSNGHLTGAQVPSLGVPKNWTGKENFYRLGALPFCDTCHMARDTQHVLRSFTDSSNGNYLPDGTLGSGMFSRQIAMGYTQGFQPILTGGWSETYMGVVGSGANKGQYAPAAWSTSGTTMPHSETAFARLWSDTSQNVCNIGGNRPPIDCFMTELGIWPTATGVTHPFIPPTSKAFTDSDCGQVNAFAIGPTVGTNAGRIDSKAGDWGVCIDGCRKFQSFCTGSEGNATNEFPGGRLECIPSDLQVGTCKACGEIGQPVCTKVGTGCDPSFNPSCSINLPCHEGFASGGVCSTTDSAAGNALIHDPPSGKVWTMDMFAIARTKQIEITGATNDAVMGAVIESSQDGVNFTFLPNGNGLLDNSSHGTSATTVLTFPKPIDLRVLRITLPSSLLVISGVKILGWRPINIGGGDIVCTNSCINPTTHMLQCGGGGCGNFPGGGHACCQGTIRKDGKHCNGNPAAQAPCILP